MTFPAEHKKPTHSLLLFSQIIHGATLSTSLNPETSSTLRHFCTTHRLVPLGEKQLKISHGPVMRPRGLGFHSHPTWSMVTGTVTSKSLLAAFAGRFLGSKTTVTFLVLPQGTKSYSIIGMKSSNAHTTFLAADTPQRTSQERTKQSWVTATAAERSSHYHLHTPLAPEMLHELSPWACLG